MERTNYQKPFVVNKIEAQEKIKKSKMADVNCKLLNLRKKPSKESEIISVIRLEEKDMVLYERKDGWAHVNTKDGKCGFVMSKFINIEGGESWTASS